jgi:hypothetical protein
MAERRKSDQCHVRLCAAVLRKRERIECNSTGDEIDLKLGVSGSKPRLSLRGLTS